MTPEEKQLLLEKYLRDDCTPEEKAHVEVWFNEQVREAVQIEGQPDFDQADLRLKEAIPELAGDTQVMGRGLFRKSEAGNYSFKALRSVPFQVAAAILIGACIVGYYYLSQDKPTPFEQASVIQPGGLHATLTLSNGRQILLDTIGNGIVYDFNGLSIKKTAQGKLVYQVSDKVPAGADELYNTITTPKGGQYEVYLQDGTHVYLNSASSLKYSSRFSGNKRDVQLSGEAYFEVAKDRKSPFQVFFSRNIIKVTGTHFNVCCYPSEPEVTTLAEGSINIYQSSSKQTKALTPGDQAIMTSAGINVARVDPSIYSSWKDKDGVFIYEGVTLKTLLASVARWYDVEVDIDDKKLPEPLFSGELKKSISLESALESINKVYKIKLTVIGRRITITNQK